MGVAPPHSPKPESLFVTDESHVQTCLQVSMGSAPASAVDPCLVLRPSRLTFGLRTSTGLSCLWVEGV